MLSTGYFQFWWEKTGVKITRETQTQDLNAPADYSTVTTIIYEDWIDSRIVTIKQKDAKTDEYAKQDNFTYLLYLDRKFIGLVETGDKVFWRLDQMGMNTTFVNNKTSNVITGYIKKVVVPQNQSINGTLECYITTNN